MPLHSIFGLLSSHKGLITSSGWPCPSLQTSLSLSNPLPLPIPRQETLLWHPSEGGPLCSLRYLSPGWKGTADQPSSLLLSHEGTLGIPNSPLSTQSRACKTIFSPNTSKSILEVKSHPLLFSLCSPSVNDQSPLYNVRPWLKRDKVALKKVKSASILTFICCLVI